MKKKNKTHKIEDKQTLDKDHLIFVFRDLKLKVDWLDNIAEEYEDIILGSTDKKTRDKYKTSIDLDVNLDDFNEYQNEKSEEYNSNDNLEDNTLDKFMSKSESDKKVLLDKINYAVQVLSRDICLDKSYVIFPENKHSKRYIKEKDWNNAVEIIKRSDFCRKLTYSDQMKIQKFYMDFIVTYIFDCLRSFGYDIYEFGIKFEKLNFIVEFYYDEVQEWKHYKGKWQNWKSEEK